jgi:hypothetical protein
MARRLATPLLVLTVLTLAAAPAAAWSLFGGEDGNGELVETTVDVDPCHAIRLECGLDLEITLGDAQRVVLTMDENLVDNYRITERAGTLVIDARKLRARDAVVTVNGAGDVELYATDSADIELNGVGDVDVYGDPARFRRDVDGLGSIARK